MFTFVPFLISLDESEAPVQRWLVWFFLMTPSTRQVFKPVLQRPSVCVCVLPMDVVCLSNDLRCDLKLLVIIVFRPWWVSRF